MWKKAGSVGKLKDDTSAKRRVRNKKEKKKRSRAQKVRRALEISLLILAAVMIPYGIYAFILRGEGEPKPHGTKTNRDAVVYSSQQKMISRMNWRFPQLTSLIQDTITVPGLRQSEALQGQFRALTTCTSMTPQGITVTEKYIFISAYCHTHKHNSNLFMLNRKTGKLIKTIALGTKAHVGGVAFDSRHRIVWVSGGTKGAAKAIGYELSELEQYDIKEMKPARAKFNYTLATITRNSYMTYADNALYIGYYTTSGLSELEKFNLTEEGGLKAQIYVDYDTLHESVVADQSAVTSGRVQGAAKEQPFLYLSKSYGISDSALQIYQVDENSNQFQDKNADKVWRFPQKLEQVCALDGKLYCLFESAAYAYRAQPALAIDRVLVFNTDDLNPEVQEPEDIVDITKS